MKIYRGYVNGLSYRAEIDTTTLNGTVEYALEVYTWDWNGGKMPEYHRLYKTEKGAEKALWRKYPDGYWSEV